MSGVAARAQDAGPQASPTPHFVEPSVRTRLVVTAGLLVVLGFLFIRVCADGGAMASAYRTCDCRGIEWKIYDRTASDGPRRTVCLGVVHSRTCYQFRAGPEVPCAN